MNHDDQVTITDLFCGAGGSSIGAESAGGLLRLGLNHWERAIETHATNFQHADHECEDVASLTTARIRQYPDSDILLASPECTNHSLAKGARRRKPQAASLFEDGPAGDEEQDRSRATMWDVIRFAEQKILKGKPYKIIVVENVVDAFNWGADDDGGLFDSWLIALRNLGYDHETVWLNSMFVPPTPQSRDRMYVVFWRKGMKRPDLTFEPMSWCPECETAVNGRQAFKKQRRGRNWGRYGPQYIYRCPGCTGTVFPGAFAAETAIDWAVEAMRIGDRERPLAEATRQRIKRGLERLAREPFALRLLQSGNPRPLTLPLVTLTQRRDMAMVLPVAGNTFERTPGNRAVNANEAPLPTVHGTADKAIVVPPMGGVDPRSAKTDPAPTQTTTTRAALVMSNLANNVPRKADKEPCGPILTGPHHGVVEMQNHGEVRSADEPVHTVRAGGHHHGVVIANYGSADADYIGWARRAEDEPLGSVTTQDHHALVVPFDRTGVPRPPEREPMPTLTQKDRAGLVELTDDDIDECLFRMFELHEIAAAMQMHLHVDGSKYVVLGNKRERMAQYGNAVTPPVMRALVGRCMEVLDG